MKYYLICFLLLLPTTSFSQLLTEREIQKIAENTNNDFQGVEIANGFILRSCLAEGRTLLYKYDIPDEFDLTDNVKSEAIDNYKKNGFAKFCYDNQINVGLAYFQKDHLKKLVSIDWNELSYLKFKLGEYISIKDHPKAKGVNLKFQPPIGWTVAEGERPNIVKKILYADNMFVVLVKDNSMFLSRKEATDLLSDDVTVQEFIKEQVDFLNNAKVLSNRIVTVDNYPTLEFTFSGFVERVGVKAKMIGKIWLVFYEDKFVFLQCSSSNLKSFNAFEPFFNRIANSVIFPEQYD